MIATGPVMGSFDAGARFTPYAPPTIPPPPPGNNSILNVIY